MAHLRKRRPLEEDVYSLALQRTEHVMDTFDSVWVSFSGGKDSTAVLNVALEVAHSDPRFARHLPLRTVFYDEEAIPYETEEYVRRVAERDDIALEWYCLPVKHRNACTRRFPWWWPWAPEAEAKWCRPLPPEAIQTLPGFPINPPAARLSMPHSVGLLTPPEAGNTAMLMGIRAQESIMRTRAVQWRSVDNYIIPWTDGTARGNLWKAYPVYDWTTEDVWAAPAALGWDYNRSYDRMEMAGVSTNQQRCSPAFGEEPLQKIHLYAQCFPEVWERMVDRVPGVGAAQRYARTELYCYHGMPDKPLGMPWPVFLQRYIEKFQPGDATLMRERLAGEIRRHYRKTTLPIAPTAPNPVSGVSWYFLAQIAMRGDFKGRKQPTNLVDEQQRPLPSAWRRYVRELHDVVKEGAVADLAYPKTFPEDLDGLVPAYAREEAGDT